MPHPATEGGACMERAMSNYNCDYVRRHYDVPAEIGRRVIANGEPGVIMADRGHYIGVILDSDPKKRIRNYHPTWEMQYGEMAEKLPLKRYQVLVAGWDWWDITNRKIVDVFASTPSQAKYKAYERCEYHDIECMFGFKVRRARPALPASAFPYSTITPFRL